MGLSESYVIATILWSILSLTASLDYIPYAKQLKGLDLFVFLIVFIIGGPIFAANMILTSLLDCILPEGWDDDDDFSKKY